MSFTTARALIQHRGGLDAWGQDRESREQYAEIAKALNEEARENWDNPAWHKQVARDLAESLDYGFHFENLFSSYFLTETVGEFDRVILRERRGLKVFYTSRGGYIEESQLRTENWELPRDTLGFHVSEHTDKLRANFAQTMEDLVTLGGNRLDAEVNRRIFNMLQTSIPSNSPFYESGPVLEQAALNDMITAVGDAIKPSGMGPVPITVAGRATMIDQISNFDGFADEAKEEIRLKGRLGVYRGANIVRIMNWTDENDESYIPANELWVFGGTVGKFAFYGDLRVKSWEENTVDYTHYRSRKDVGGLIHHPEQARRFILTSEPGGGEGGEG